MNTRLILLSAACGLASAASAVAQTAQPPATMSPGQTAPAASSTSNPMPASKTAEAMPTRQMPGQLLASDYLSFSVYGPNNEKIGGVNDLLIDENGRVTGVLVGVGGFLGLGEKTVAIPLGELRPNGGTSNQLTTGLTKSDLDRAPAFVPAKMDATNTGTSTGTGNTAPKN